MTVRVLIIDDSPTMRALIRNTLSRRADLEVVGEAGDPLVARSLIRERRPDVLTLDVEMPNMNGLEFLDRLMRLNPLPVVMVSSLTQAGAEASLAALELGAVDCVGKPTRADEGLDRLADIVHEAAFAKVADREIREPARPLLRTGLTAAGKIIALGASTGGVEALIRVLSDFPADCPATLITQHMPANFTTSFAARLNRLCAPTVSEACDGDPVERGRVYLAPGGDRHLEIARGNGRLVCTLRCGPPVSGHRPSVDVLFRSVAEVAGPGSLGALLTGMGRDGAEGLLAMRQAGARTFAQDEQSSVVFGMPRAAAEIGAAAQVVGLNRMAAAVLGVGPHLVGGDA
ncbi:MAG: protein-glutamate methylesterase/protein-glutamine glutaminase [Brevundimonas sp.]|uniref:protein-glutamate methylesterase/protein-glutamine glutaminase n=1 Tax=Brevundimonas sp. TaxID=1871086 RepID=UPI0040338B9D